ncbi:C25 family cysteine peptidase [Dyadobacter sp. CY323]|uniref:putative type IX secretion system sortase PorU2 n=1 Tax=Dyadobacter sp. CY323 TaxID=2907302 RepID=UPI001F42D7E4|nr:C25 family cysteine peptidase [Dyadobacter sp. CY323]MCE6988519.1 C25 family cysteine peptidase [Dyadobacter sp. CY323]
MKHAFIHTITCYFILVFNHVSAQKQFGNEWINPHQTYFKIPISETGLYQVTVGELINAGFPADSILASSIQLFRRGSELAIEVTLDKSGKLGENGNIQFYGEKNDGAADSLLYVSPKSMPHSHYSLYSDTAAYFLSWRVDGLPAKRVFEHHFQDTKNRIEYHFEENIQLFNSHYLPGKFYPAGSNFDTGSVLTDYDAGEGWTGPEIPENQSFEMVFNTVNAMSEQFTKAEIELVLTGWTSGKHIYEVWNGDKANLKRKIATVDFSDYETSRVHALLQKTDLNPDGKVNLTLLPVDKGGHISVSFARLRYPQKSSFETGIGQKRYYFDSSQNARWSISAGKDVRFYDCSDPFNVRKLAQENSEILIGNSSKVIGVNQKLKIGKMQVTKLGTFENLQTDYLIISHPLMHIPVAGRDPVTEYANYRHSETGGNYNVLVEDITEVYDQFNYGDPGPSAIRNIISFLQKEGKLKMALLIGRSIDPQKARKLPQPSLTDMIPNAGWPGSDIALAMTPGESGDSYPIVSVGRINALTSENVLDYLHKVQAVEAEPASAPWRKNVLHLSGGRSRDELAAFKGYVHAFEKKLIDLSFPALVKTISKISDDPVEQVPIHNELNKGVSLITLFGHSSLDVTDIDMGYASNPANRYRNHPRYPAVIVNGCASGSIFHSTNTLSSDWIFSPNNGAVLFLAHTFNGNSLALNRYTDIFYEVLSDSNFTHQPFGLIQQEAIKRNLSRNPTIYDRITVRQMNLHGDPAIRIFPGKLTPNDSAPEKPNDLPLTISVRLNGRQLADNEFIQPKPTISIELRDFNISLSDTTALLIWVKQKCNGCPEKRIYLNRAVWKKTSSGHITMDVDVPKPFMPGTYRLTVQASDSNRNVAPVYQINFRVSGEKQIFKVGISPNPSSKWFKIKFELEDTSETCEVQLKIFNVSGTAVHTNTFKPRIGINEWFWHPGELPTGVYVYRLTISGKDISVSDESEKTFEGRLIWVD